MGATMPIAGSCAKTWLLPEGVEDTLTGQALPIEKVRRRLLDLLLARGYGLVETPLVEFVESLLVQDNADLNAVTCKITDHYTGRMMGVRADMTPQVARIDAHVKNSNNVERYCYVSPVLLAQMPTHSNSRVPLQLGAEIFGAASIDADIEVLDAMLAVLAQTTTPLHNLYVELGHVALLQSLFRVEGLALAEQQQLQGLYQTKATYDIASKVQGFTLQADFMLLAVQGNNLEALQTQLSANVLRDAAVAKALSDLHTVRQHLAEFYPQLNVLLDGAEVSSYQYHNGLVFAVYTPGSSHAIAKGGRYDSVGLAFGRERAATGFSADVLDIMALGVAATPVQVVQAPSFNGLHNNERTALNTAIEALRLQGYVVVQPLANEACAATWQLVFKNDGWALAAVLS